MIDSFCMAINHFSDKRKVQAFPSRSRGASVEPRRTSSQAHTLLVRALSLPCTTEALDLFRELAFIRWFQTKSFRRFCFEREIIANALVYNMLFILYFYLYDTFGFYLAQR